jgi:hypothetical protein
LRKKTFARINILCRWFHVILLYSSPCIRILSASTTHNLPSTGKR